MSDGPPGRQFVTGSSRLKSTTRFRNSASAAGRKIAWSCRSWIRLKRYGLGSGPHKPERSGAPSAVRGAGAARFGRPSACTVHPRRAPVQPLCAHRNWQQEQRNEGDSRHGGSLLRLTVAVYSRRWGRGFRAVFGAPPSPAQERLRPRVSAVRVRDTDGKMITAAMGRSEDRLVKRDGKWLIQWRKLTVFTG